MNDKANPLAAASHYQSGMILRSQNNTNQRTAFDWVEFETAP